MILSAPPIPAKALRFLILAAVLSVAGCTAEPDLTDGIVEFTTRGVSGEPNLYGAPDGKVYLTWFEESAQGDWKLNVAVRGPEGWTGGRSIIEGRDFFVNWADFPSLVVLDEQQWLVHWLERVPGNKYAYHVKLARSSDGGQTWSPPFSPHQDTSATEHGFVSMARAHDGTVVAVWLDGRQMTPYELESRGDMSVRATVINSSGVALDQLIDARSCECCNTTVTVARSGPVAAYRDRSATEVRNITVSRLVDGRWSDPVPVHDDNWTYPACPVNGPALDSRGDTVAIAWYTAPAETGPVVYAAFSENGGKSFGTPVRVDEGMPLGRVDLVMIDSTAAFVTWLERNDEAATMRARLVDLDGTFGKAQTIARTDARRSSGFPRAVRSDDMLLVAWTDVQEDGNRVRVSAYRIAR